jgi:hypothetical protein
MINSMDATMPEINFDSLMPRIFSMVPINGQIRLNDQVFNVGPNETLTSPQVPSPDSSTPTVGSRSSNFESRIPNFDSRIPNFRSQIPNFDSRIPNFESRIPNFNSAPNPIQTQSSTLTNANRFNEPVLRSTPPTPTMDTMPFGIPINERNFRPLPIPMRARSNVNPSEMSLIVAPDKIARTEGSPMNAPPVSIPPQMPQMTQNERNALMSSTPVLTPPQEPQINENGEDITERFQPLPISVSGPINGRREETPLSPTTVPTFPQMPQINNNQRSGSQQLEPIVISGPDNDREETPIFIVEGSPDSMQVTRETSFVFPPATINQIPAETANGEPNARSALEQHLPPVTAEPQAFNSSVSIPSDQFENSVIPIRFMSSLFRPQRIPTLEELDKITAERTQSLAPIN